MSGNGKIAIYGATGFTGGLIARELRGRGAELVLAGRNREKLAPLAAELDAEAVAVAADDGPGLRRLLEPCSVVVACAGPFVLHGEGVLAAAAATGTHYLDTTGEQPFIRTAIERYGETAERNGSAVVAGMGFDFVPGDMGAALTAAGMGPLEEIAIAYNVHDFTPTHGTALSALEMMVGGDVVWEDGGRRPAPRSAEGGRWTFAAPVGEQRMLRYPAGEQITVPLHIETRRVRTLLSGMAGPPAMTGLMIATTPLFAAAMRRPRLRRTLGSLARRMPAAPADSARAAVRFMVECEARAGSRVRRGRVSGSDVYGMTARSLAEAALRCADPGYDRRGGLAPAQAFDPAEFLDAIGLETEIDPLPAATPA